MSDAGDWNAKTIAEFREERWTCRRPVRGSTACARAPPRSQERARSNVTPVMYLPDQKRPQHDLRVRVQRGELQRNPDWYYNLTSTGEGKGRARHRHLPSLGQRGDRHRARPHLRRTGAALPRLRRVRTPDRRHPEAPVLLLQRGSGPSRPATASPQLARSLEGELAPAALGIDPDHVREIGDAVGPRRDAVAGIRDGAEVRLKGSVERYQHDPRRDRSRRREPSTEPRMPR